MLEQRGVIERDAESAWLSGAPARLNHLRGGHRPAAAGPGLAGRDALAQAVFFDGLRVYRQWQTCPVPGPRYRW
jgi:hypothetical protein